MELALSYEHFLRDAFSYDERNNCFRRNVERSGDPAGLANADLVNDNELTLVKVGTSYAIKIFISVICNNTIDERFIDNSESDKIDSYIDKVIQSNSMQEILSLIEEFKNHVWERYLIQDGSTLRVKMS